MTTTSVLSLSLRKYPTGDVDNREFLAALQARNIQVPLETVDSQVDCGQQVQLRERRKAGDFVVGDIQQFEVGEAVERVGQLRQLVGLEDEGGEVAQPTHGVGDGTQLGLTQLQEVQFY